MRSLVRWLGSGVAIAGFGALLLAAWGALRIARYEQREDPRSLERKAAELERMAAAAAGASGSERPERPNWVVILFDDLGHGDVGVFGGRALETPRMDALARQGIALDHFYSAAPVCSPARAGLLTGRWPIRSLPQVVFPSGHWIDRGQRLMGRRVRLPADEITLAEALGAAGYASAAIGKWHLGDRSPSLPRDLGFERWFGLLYSNDMTPLALWRDERVIEPDPVDQTTLTPRYTREAIDFIEAHRARPFFLYLAHTSPHIPLHATPGQRGRSRAGLYGDVVADLDRSVGEVLDALERLGLAERTLVVVTSDNGPWFQGSPGASRGRKGSLFEGGMRVPFLARWPGRIPAGVRSDAVAAAIDLFPTALALAGVPLPRDRVIDGVDLWPALSGSGPLPERPILFYDDRTLGALRLGRYKWHDRRGLFYDGAHYAGVGPLFERGPWLFDLSRDPLESYDVHERQPEVFARLARRAAEQREQIASNPRGWREPAAQRPQTGELPRPETRSASAPSEIAKKVERFQARKLR